MKKYIFTTLAITLMASCTPETEVLKELRKENPVAPTIKNKTPLDLTKTQAVFSPDQVSKEITRNADTKEIAETSFTFAPKLIRRQLATGEILKLKVEQSTSQYEVSLPQEAYTLEKAEVSSDQANDVFKVTLNKEGCKALEANKEYVLRLKLSVSAKTPESLPVEVKDAFYKIKVTFKDTTNTPGGGTDDDDDIQEGEYLTIVDNITETLMENTAYEFSSNYFEQHLSKLKNNNSSQNWWVDTRKPEIYLKATFSPIRPIEGIVITLKGNDKKPIGEVKVYASSEGEEVFLGQYTQDRDRDKIYIKFKVPIEAEAILLKDFHKPIFATDNYINIYKVEFF